MSNCSTSLRLLFRIIRHVEGWSILFLSKVTSEIEYREPTFSMLREVIRTPDVMTEKDRQKEKVASVLASKIDIDIIYK